MAEPGGDGLRRAFERAAAQRDADALRPLAEGIGLVTFHLSGEWYAFRLTDLVEIVGGVEPTPIPFAPSFVLGVINHRGAIVPVVDLRRALGLAIHYRRGAFRTILVRDGGTTLGFQADAIASIEAIPPDAIEAPMETMGPDKTQFLEGCVRRPKGLLGLLSAPALIDGLRSQRTA